MGQRLLKISVEMVIGYDSPQRGIPKGIDEMCLGGGIIRYLKRTGTIPSDAVALSGWRKIEMLDETQLKKQKGRR